MALKLDIARVVSLAVGEACHGLVQDYRYSGNPASTASTSEGGSESATYPVEYVHQA